MTSADAARPGEPASRVAASTASTIKAMGSEPPFAIEVLADADDHGLAGIDSAGETPGGG